MHKTASGRSATGGQHTSRAEGCVLRRRMYRQRMKVGVPCGCLLGVAFYVSHGPLREDISCRDGHSIFGMQGPLCVTAISRGNTDELSFKKKAARYGTGKVAGRQVKFLHSKGQPLPACRPTRFPPSATKIADTAVSTSALRPGHGSSPIIGRGWTRATRTSPTPRNMQAHNQAQERLRG